MLIIIFILFVLFLIVFVVLNVFIVEVVVLRGKLIIVYIFISGVFFNNLVVFFIYVGFI